MNKIPTRQPRVSDCLNSICFSAPMCIRVCGSARKRRHKYSFHNVLFALRWGRLFRCFLLSLSLTDGRKKGYWSALLPFSLSLPPRPLSASPFDYSCDLRLLQSPQSASVVSGGGKYLEKSPGFGVAQFLVVVVQGAELVGGGGGRGEGRSRGQVAGHEVEQNRDAHNSDAKEQLQRRKA